MAFRLSNDSRPPRRGQIAAAALGVGLAVSLAAVPGTASGKPRPTVASVQAEIAVLDSEARVARTRYATAVSALQSAEASLQQTTAAVAAAEAKLSRVRRGIGELAAASYRSGGSNALLRLLLADDPDALLQSADWVEQTADYQAEALRRVVAVRADLERDQAAKALELSRLTQARAAIAAEQRSLTLRATKVRALLASLQPVERQQVETARPASAPARTTASRTAVSTTPAPAAAGSCPPSGSRGAESRLTPATLRIMRCGLAAFPQISTAGGWGTRGGATDHDDGRAVDFMISNYRSAAGNDLGWAIAEWATRQPNISYVIFDQMQYGTWDRRWKPMSNRGSDTANHRDHVHVSVAG